MAVFELLNSAEFLYIFAHLLQADKVSFALHIS